MAAIARIPIDTKVAIEAREAKGWPSPNAMAEAIKGRKNSLDAKIIRTLEKDGQGTVKSVTKLAHALDIPLTKLTESEGAQPRLIPKYLILDLESVNYFKHVYTARNFEAVVAGLQINGCDYTNHMVDQDIRDYFGESTEVADLKKASTVQVGSAEISEPTQDYEYFDDGLPAHHPDLRAIWESDPKLSYKEGSLEVLNSFYTMMEQKDESGSPFSLLKKRAEISTWLERLESEYQLHFLVAELTSEHVKDALFDGRRIKVTTKDISRQVYVLTNTDINSGGIWYKSWYSSN